METRQLTPTLTLFESQLFRTVTTCIHTNDYLLLVDPNWLPDEVEEIAAFVRSKSLHKERFLLFTHSDYDHIIGYRRFPGFTTIASQNFVDNPRAAQQLQQARDWDDEYYIRRKYPLTYPVIHRPIAGEGEKMQLGQDDYLFYQAPGHNYDGLLTFNRSQGILIAGDYLSNIEFPYVYHSFAAYRKTLATLKGLVASGEVRILITGHGDAATDVAEMELRIRESVAYLDQLEEAVRQGTDFDLEALFKRYDFPGIMQKFHAKNEALLRQQL